MPLAVLAVSGQGQNMFNTALKANFGETWYDWEHMRESYSGAYTDEEAKAVATLMFHCGVAVNMIYGLLSKKIMTRISYASLFLCC